MSHLLEKKRVLYYLAKRGLSSFFMKEARRELARGKKRGA